MVQHEIRLRLCICLILSGILFKVLSSNHTLLRWNYIREMASKAVAFKEVDLSQLRSAYSSTVFTEDQLVSHTNPFAQFHDWFQQALKCKEIVEPQAVSVSTCTKDGKPSSRVVLMKSYTDGGFIFYTSYNSRKGKELTENPLAAMLFYWAPLYRQVRIEGKVDRIPEEDSTKYYHSRPHANQISAAIKLQSQEIASRDVLEQKFQEVLEQYPADGAPVPKPPEWGGYILTPVMFEFWQGQSTRLHDRIVFNKDESSGEWTVKRLGP